MADEQEHAHTHTPWPFGQEMRRRRLAQVPKMSMQNAASAAGMSSTRWSNLERGISYQHGQRVPINTTESTVRAVAAVLDWPVDEALELAGLRAPTASSSRVDDEIRELWSQLTPAQQDAVRATMRSMAHSPSPGVHSTSRTDPDLEQQFVAPSADEPERQDNHG